MRAIICTSERFAELNEKAVAHIQNQHGSNCKVWCKKKIHPKDGRIAFIIKDRILPVLDGEKILDLTGDWFVNTEI